jgi:hypothetical protein
MLDSSGLVLLSQPTDFAGHAVQVHGPWKHVRLSAAHQQDEVDIAGPSCQQHSVRLHCNTSTHYILYTYEICCIPNLPGKCTPQCHEHSRDMTSAGSILVSVARDIYGCSHEHSRDMTSAGSIVVSIAHDIYGCRTLVHRISHRLTCQAIQSHSKQGLMWNADCKCVARLLKNARRCAPA